MKLIRSIYLVVMLLSTTLFCACTKDWLNAKPNKSLVVPATIADYQALLDNSTVMNVNGPSLTLVGDGDYQVGDAVYAGLTPPEQSAYVWAPTTDNFYGGFPAPDWQQAYNRILNDNVVLDGIQTLQVDPGIQTGYNNVKGSALFYRSYDFYCLSQEYCKLYNSATANTDLGLPLRTSSNINLTVNRSSVKQTYDQMISDLLTAEQLLPVTPLFPTRPSKPAVYGLLSRIYLSQQNYSKALLYADSCLQLQSSLIDFNELTTSSLHPIPLFNKEVIFHFNLSTYGSFLTRNHIVDSVLYRSYSPNDLRIAIYFTTVAGNKAFKGAYNGSRNFFGGLATDEMYLTRAECYARAGNATVAMSDLNTLLRARWKTGTYTDMTVANADSALSLILTERRKELCFRNLRWTDLRRLNIDPLYKTTITRIINGQTYMLPPNSPRYVFPLDPIEIQLGGLQQNPR
jgi:hypothetical protein